MLHHLSISVDNPLHVAEVLAEVWQGHFFPFPIHDNSYIVLAADQYGTAIEILPNGAELLPGLDDLEVVQRSARTHFSAVHAAISVPTNQEKIEQIGWREGWLTRLCDRGPFKVIEFWVENKVLLELLTPTMVASYCDFMTPANFEVFLTAAQSA